MNLLNNDINNSGAEIRVDLDVSVKNAQQPVKRRSIIKIK